MKKTLSLILFTILCPFLLTAESPALPRTGYEVGFSPGGTALALVLKAIGSAQSSLDMAAYELTSQPIAEALAERAQKGVTIRVVADWKASKDKHSVIGFLEKKGISVRVDKKYAIHHHKFMVIDGKTLETGSFNFTKSADQHNAENVIVLWNAGPPAQDFEKEWLRLWNESVPTKD